MMKQQLIFSFLMICQILVAQQQGLVTQYMYNKVTVNPAFAGHSGDKSIAGHLREQWIGIKGAPSLQMISFDMPFMESDNGWGMNIRRSSIGISSKTSISGMYAYKIPVTDGFLSFGLEPGIQNFRMNFGDPDLFAYDGIEADESLNGKTVNKNTFLLGFGAYYSNEKAYFGVSIPSLFTTNFDIDQNTIKSGDELQINLMAGYTFLMDDDKSFMIQGFSRYTARFPLNLDLNATLLLDKKFDIGLGYRIGSGVLANLHKSVTGTFGLKISENVFAAFSYDYALSALRYNQIGSFEVLASYRFPRKTPFNPGLNPRFF
ncbi:MAG TPA: PorP/SprF family type IX secretion system membrane protein [Saprospiraceae bacterium]|nr:PorP/SprF family type IX secretion system membrane protein [Saprospiraceae bacterium]HPN70159.1 PorP/SprF family type IX secretion system membrane protein [Saprospiraceae bacterium]